MSDVKDLLNSQIRPIRIKDLLPQDHLLQTASATSHIFEARKNLLGPLQPFIEEMNRNHLEFTNRFKPALDQVQHSLVDLADRLKPIYDQFSQVSLALAETFKPMFDQAKLFVPILNDLIRGFEEFNVELREKHEQDMLFLPPFFNEYTLPEIREMLLDSDRPAIEVYFDIFSDRQNLEKLLVQWGRNPHFTDERLTILADALEAHRNGKYTLAVPTLISQLEGLMLEAFEIDQGQIPWAIKEGFPKKSKDRSYISYIAGSHVMQDILLTEVFNSNRKEGYGPKGIYPHRPTIQHGVNTSYFKNPHSTTRLIMLIDFISSEDFQEGAKQFKLKRKSRNQG